MLNLKWTSQWLLKGPEAAQSRGGWGQCQNPEAEAGKRGVGGWGVVVDKALQVILMFGEWGRGDLHLRIRDKSKSLFFSWGS